MADEIDGGFVVQCAQVRKNEYVTELLLLQFLCHYCERIQLRDN